MSWRKILATTIRVLRQLRHDKRTVTLLLFIPSFIVLILYFVLADARPFFNAYAPLILTMMAFTALFLVSSIATLRERRAGTLDRLMTLPVGKMDIILGYSLAFALIVVVQSVIAIVLVLGLLNVDINGSPLQLLLITMLSGLAGMSFGLTMSEFAETEFQAVQFMPAFIFPQLLTCGLLIPREQMAGALQWFANAMPLTYIVEATKTIISTSGWSIDLTKDVLVVLLYILTVLFFGALTLRRQR